ncbi:MAG: PDDEXK nuclease domain-containing protein [Paludibacter sp.]|nr:PDDEXK nuclease domain-containing protein [Paludibacter sp.]
MNDIELRSKEIISGVLQIIDTARNRVAIYVNAETTHLFYEIGKYLHLEILKENRAEYGYRIVATVSQQLTMQLGKGYTYTALTRMIKVAKAFNDENIATLSQQLSWSHFIELSGIENELKRKFYTELCAFDHWGVRVLRDKIDSMMFERSAIASRPEEIINDDLQHLCDKKEISPDLVFKNTYVLDFLQLSHHYSESELEQALIDNIQAFILELGVGFAFLERQKRISVDSVDYHLDLLFYHRKLHRLVAIDLKLGKFKPKYKSNMELYLRWLEVNEMQPGEEKPIGLLLCSEGNTEHIELLMLDEKEIKVAQYLTELPSKQWFADKLRRAVEIAKMNH